MRERYVVFGDSATASLRYFFKEENRVEEIININEPFTFEDVTTIESKDVLDLGSGDGVLLKVLLSDGPLDQVGLRYLVSKVKKGTFKIFYREAKNMAMFPPHELGEIVSEEGKILTESEILKLREEWEGIYNTPCAYRLYEDGVLKLVDETYFDHLIFSQLNKEKMKFLKLVGLVLGHYGYGISDEPIIQRVLELCRAGLIGYTGDIDNYYEVEVYKLEE